MNSGIPSNPERQNQSQPVSNAQQSPKLLTQVRNKMRVLHDSIRTESAYVDWIVRFRRVLRIRRCRRLHSRLISEPRSVLVALRSPDSPAAVLCMLNSAAAAKRVEYNRELYDLPTIDHVGDGLGAANFAICSWRVNDAKHVQTFDEFVEMCRLVVTFNEKNADVLNDASKSRVGREF